MIAKIAEFPIVCGALLLLSTLSSSSSAEIIELQFTGIDISYDGATISDSAVGPDSLTSLIVLEDDVATAGSPFTSDIAIELSIPGVAGIDVTGDQVVSSPGGSLTLTMPGGDFLALALGEVTVTYVDSDPSFVFGGTIAGVVGQSLPGGLVMSDPVTFSFSTTVESLSTSGGDVTSFEASGTGEIRDVIPEPTTAALALLGLLAISGARRGS